MSWINLPQQSESPCPRAHHAIAILSDPNNNSTTNAVTTSNNGDKIILFGGQTSASNANVRIVGQMKYWIFRSSFIFVQLLFTRNNSIIQ